MKYQLKMALYLLSIISTLILTSCSKDLYEEDEKTIEGRLKTTTLDNIPFLKEAIESKKAKNKISSREIDYLEYIDPNKVIYVTDENNYKTFTFGLTISESDKLTNVSIKETSEGYKFYLIKYSGANYIPWIEAIKTLGVSEIIPEVNLNEMGRYNSD